MYKILWTLSFFMWSMTSFAQELNCKVIVSADQIVEANRQIFKTLESTVTDFMNQTKWTSKTYAPHEKIECSILFTLIQQVGNSGYIGNIQVQSARPVFNSIYSTPVLNYRDEDLSFSYTEFEPLNFEVNSFQSELVSTLSYFAYMIIGLDADTFELNGGEEYFVTAQKIVNQVENPNDKKAWKSNTNKFNRYIFLNKILSPTFKNYRASLYNYHFKGLDQMSQNLWQGKEMVLESLLDMSGLASGAMDSQLIRTFMDAKADEIVDIFSGGPEVELGELMGALNRMAPTSAQKWEQIKN